MSDHTSLPAKILPCTCQHEYQDDTHGEAQRVHNPFKAVIGKVGYRCTVCRRTKD
jgi:hypothetical protein